MTLVASNFVRVVGNHSKVVACFLLLHMGCMLFFTARNSYGAVDLFYMPDSSWTHWMVKSVREVDSDIFGAFW